MAKYIEKDFPIAKLNVIAEKEGNARKPIYQIHKWWARRIGSVFRMILLTSFLDNDITEDELWGKFYSKNDFNGKTVLDPFMGGGTTIIEALRLGLKVIGIDLNPVAWFVVKKEVDPVDLQELQKAFKKVEAKVADKIKSFYKTICPRCHNEVDVIYTFWVKKVRCVNCKKDVKLFNNFRIATLKDSEVLLCPKCGDVFSFKGKENIATCTCGNQFDLTKGYAERGEYHCQNCHQRYPVLKALKEEGNNPPRTEIFALEYYCACSGKKRGYKKVEDFDLQLYEKAKKEFEEKRDELIGKWIPEQDVKDGLKTKDLLNYNYFYFYQMFNERQLLLLSDLLKAIAEEEDENIREFLLLAFSNTIEANNIFGRYNFSRFEVEGIFARHAYWPLLTPCENNIWGVELGKSTFTKLYKQLYRAKEFVKDPFERIGDEKKYTKDYFVSSNNSKILSHSSENLDLKSNFIDAIITDPPYYDNVMYSELSDFFYVWLRLLLKDKYECFKPLYTPKIPEIVVNNKQGKTKDDFIEGLTRVFSECYRVLKDDGLLVFTFHHKETKAWASALKAVLNSNFYIEAAYPIHSEMKTSTHILNKQSISYDTIIVCRKKLQDKKEKVSWEILKDSIFIKAKKEIEEIKKYKGGFAAIGEKELEFNTEMKTQEIEKKLGEADVFVIVIGKCLELFSKNYPDVMKNGQRISVEQAIEDIEDIVESLILEDERKFLPSGLDDETKFYLVYLLGKKDISYDELNKRCRSGGYDITLLEDAGLVEKKKSKYIPLGPDVRKEFVSKKRERLIDWLHFLYNGYKSGENIHIYKQNTDSKKIAEISKFAYNKTGDKVYLEIKTIFEN